MKSRPTGLLPRFVECARDSGIVFQRYDDQRGLHRIIEANGGGVALFDFDRNGYLDVFLTNGCRLPLKTNDRSHPSALFASEGGIRFEDVAELSGLQPFGYAAGCTTGDFDGDGFDDLYVTAYGRNSLWRNNGDGTFTDATDEAGVAVGRWSSSAAFCDVNRDGHLDLYVVNYVQAADDPPRLCPTPGSPDGYVQCAPTVFRAEDDVLFLGDGTGKFVNVTLNSGTKAVDGKGLGVVVFDANQDDWPDIYVANDGMPNFLFLNTTPKKSRAIDVLRFQESAGINGAAVNDKGEAEASMGLAVGDIDGDGWSDLFMTHFFAESNTLYRNRGKGRFEDQSSRSRLGPISRDKVGFGTMFLDFENDGRLDLIVSNGHVDDFSYARRGEEYAMAPQFFRNAGDGRFEDVSNYSGDYFLGKWIGRGVATGDLDNDGDIDIVVSHQRSASAVLRNETPTTNGSLQLTLIGTGASNRSAFGAVVEVVDASPKIVREIVGGGSFQSASDRQIHIGLGKLGIIPKLRVRWPSGTIEEFSALKPGRHIIVEGQGVARPSAL